MKKKSILSVIGGLFMFPLFVYVANAQELSNPMLHEKYVADFIYFPFGSGTTITKKITVQKSNNYKVNILFDFIDGQVKLENDRNNGSFNEMMKQEKTVLGKNNDVQFSFTVKGYKVNNKDKELIYQKSFSNSTYVQAATWAMSANERNKAYRVRYDLINLKKGEYEFEITDNSSTNHKFSFWNTYIAILEQDINH